MEQSILVHISKTYIFKDGQFAKAMKLKKGLRKIRKAIFAF